MCEVWRTAEGESLRNPGIYGIILLYDPKKPKKSPKHKALKEWRKERRNEFRDARNERGRNVFRWIVFRRVGFDTVEP